MKKLEQQLKRVNPQAFQSYQQARKENRNPNEYLNGVIDGFNPEQKQQWEQMMSQFNQK
jgi:hypothetical protein